MLIEVICFSGVINKFKFKKRNTICIQFCWEKKLKLD